MAVAITKSIYDLVNNSTFIVFTGPAGQVSTVTYDAAPGPSGSIPSSEVAPGIYRSQSVPFYAGSFATSVTATIGAEFDNISLENLMEGVANTHVTGVDTSGAPTTSIVSWYDDGTDVLDPVQSYGGFWDSSYKMDVLDDDLGYTHAADSTSVDPTGRLNFESTLSPSTVPLGSTVYFMGKVVYDQVVWTNPISTDYVVYSFTNGSAPSPSTPTQEPVVEDRDVFSGGLRLGESLPGTLTPPRISSRGLRPESFIDDIEHRFKT